MRNLYRELFYVPKHGKVNDKVMLVRIAIFITIIVTCLIAMSFTAYAYFSYNVTSASNTIKAADFFTDVTVQITEANGAEVVDCNITPITSDNKNFKIEGLEVGKWYIVTIEPSTLNTSNTGFIIVSADNCKTIYHTQQLGIDENVQNGETTKICFKLKLTDTANVFLKSHWGTSSFYSKFKTNGKDDEQYITQNEEITMTIVRVEPTPETETLDTSSKNEIATSQMTETSQNENAIDSCNYMVESENTQSINPETNLVDSQY